ncbi:MAG: tRNA (N6-isopentenyl adenosine(37)-C2)-methylthiotransferase MiaB, partial [Clostridia bacterium]|nr:tRNA (N6-isopentenyl adenosine(37)-C2)-methylthiotransferase MiaB [Clostridia bacterium]
MSKRDSVVLSSQEVEKQKDKILEIKHLLSDRKNKKAFIETYGCQQNVSDSEIIMGMLCEMGFEKTENKDEADIIIFNTCAVRENAELKVYGNLGALKHLKLKKPDLIIGVCGCMMQQEEVSKRIKS